MSYQPAAIDEQVARLKAEISASETRLSQLRQELLEIEQRSKDAKQHDIAQVSHHVGPNGDAPNVQSGPSKYARSTSDHTRWPMEPEEYRRYGRQMIMPEVGIHGQLNLKRARVLVIGIGGLGCPAATYLAGAGIGTLGLVDGDTVELSNLHRQIAHSTSRVGANKAESGREYLTLQNPSVKYECHAHHLNVENALRIIEQYDIVLDCTDHPTSRYLISDACVLAGKPLVSASALRTEGQLIVLNHPPRPPGDTSGGPCYRCVFPKPPPMESVLACADAGVLGPVVGVMGVLQALEAIKLLVARANAPVEDLQPTLLVFSAFSRPPFRSVRMRSRRAACAACSSNLTITRDSLASGAVDYASFCGLNSPSDLLAADQRISPKEFAHLSQHPSSITLIDTRDETQFAICSLPGSINVPWTGNTDVWIERAHQLGAVPIDSSDCFVVCRFGNDSQLAVKALRDRTPASRVKDIRGGLRAWRNEIDPGWPDY